MAKSDVISIDTNKLSTGLSHFNSAKSKYNNNVYDTYKNSYFKTCSNSQVAKLRKNCDKLYEKLKKMYKNINKYTDDYIKSVQDLENDLKNGTSKTASVAAAINQLNAILDGEDPSEIEINNKTGEVEADMGWFEKWATNGHGWEGSATSINIEKYKAANAPKKVTYIDENGKKVIVEGYTKEEQNLIITAAMTNNIQYLNMVMNSNKGIKKKVGGLYTADYANCPAVMGFLKASNPLPITLDKLAGIKYTKKQQKTIDASKSSFKYGAGYFAGMAFSYITGGGAIAEKPISAAILKGAAKKGIVNKKGLNFAVNRASDVISSAPLNINDSIKGATDANGNIDYKKAIKLMGLNTAADIAFGGIIDGVISGVGKIKGNGAVKAGIDRAKQYAKDVADLKYINLNSKAGSIKIPGFNRKGKNIKGEKEIYTGNGKKSTPSNNNSDISEEQYYIVIGDKEYEIPTTVSMFNKEIFEGNKKVVGSKKYLDLSKLINENKRQDVEKIVDQCVAHTGDMIRETRLETKWNDIGPKIRNLDNMSKILFESGKKDLAYKKQIELMELVMDIDSEAKRLDISNVEIDVGLGKTDINGNVKKYSDSTEKIKEKFCQTYDLDYINDVNDRKLVNAIMDKIEADNFLDEDVKYLFNNLDKLKDINPKLSIGYWDSGSAFWGGQNVLVMNYNDLDVADMILTHELGHVIYDTVQGSSKNWQPELTGKNRKALEIARNNISRNQSEVKNLLDICSEYENKAFNETVEWYKKYKEHEERRISNSVDNMYKSNQLDELKNEIASAKDKLNKVKIILEEAGLSDVSVDDLMSNKDVVKEIAIVQNNINKQNAYYSKLNGSYEKYGDYRKISSIIDSITQSDDNYSFTYGHSKDYWQKREDPDLSSYNELLADYVSLSANGRTDVIKKLEQVCGPELFNDIRNTLNEIVIKLGG